MYTLAWGIMSFVGFMFMAVLSLTYAYVWFKGYNVFSWNEKKYKCELLLLLLTGISFLSYLPLLLTENYWFLLVGVCPYLLFFCGNVCLYGLSSVLKIIKNTETKNDIL